MQIFPFCHNLAILLSFEIVTFIMLCFIMIMALCATEHEED